MARKAVDEEQKRQFGQRLKMWRKFRGLTMMQLAELMDVDYTTIYVHEYGKSYPPDTVILRYADVLQIRPQQLEDRQFTDVPGVCYGTTRWHLLMRDWRLYTVEEIAAELGVTRHAVDCGLTDLRKTGRDVLFTRKQPGTGKRLDPPERRLSPRESVKHSHCKGCRYGLTKGAAMPTGCLYYCYTGRHRPNPIGGTCPAKDTSKRARNVYKGVK